MGKHFTFEPLTGEVVSRCVRAHEDFGFDPEGFRVSPKWFVFGHNEKTLKFINNVKKIPSPFFFFKQMT